MKSPDERGPLAAWAYEARVKLNLSPETVVKELGRYNPATIRKAETLDRHMSRPLWRTLTALYPRIAHEKGIAIPIPPGHMGLAAGDDTSSVASSALIAALTAQTKAITALVERLDLMLPSEKVREMLSWAAEYMPAESLSPDPRPDPDGSRARS